MSRPSILYIHSHDTARYVSPCRYAGPTPHIRQLAEESLLDGEVPAPDGAQVNDPTANPL